MSTAVFNLERILQQEITLYRDILAIEEAKQLSILARNGRELETHTAREESMVSSLTALEKERMSLLDDLYAKTGRRGQPTLGEVLLFLDGPEAERLTTKGRELKTVMQSVRSKQETNARLLQDNIDFFNLMLNGLRDSAGSSFTYTRSGTNANAGYSNLLFNQTI